MTTNVERWGNSLAVRIPKAVAEKLSIEEGSEIQLTVTDKGIELIPKKETDA